MGESQPVKLVCFADFKLFFLIYTLPFNLSALILFFFIVKLYIESSNSTTPLIYGEFDNDILITYQWEDENTWGTHGGGAGTKGKFVHNEDELDEDDFGEEPDWENSEEYDVNNQVAMPCLYQRNRAESSIVE